MNKKEINKRQLFLNRYTEFNIWLMDIGFRPYNSNSPNSYHYSHYNEHIDALYSVESYSHSIFGISILFIRDRNVHKLMEVNSGKYSKLVTIKNFKKELLNSIKELKKERLKLLNSINL